MQSIGRTKAQGGISPGSCTRRLSCQAAGQWPTAPAESLQGFGAGVRCSSLHDWLARWVDGKQDGRTRNQQERKNLFWL